MKILAFGASNSRRSINQAFALWAARQWPAAQVQTLNIADYEIPIYSPEREEQLGQPALAQAFLQRLQQADLLIISFAEHNGGFTAAWKNLSDWVSRIERRYLKHKTVLLLATSSGAGGGQQVLAQARSLARSAQAQIIDAIALPEFQRHYQEADQELDYPAVVERVRLAVHITRTASIDNDLVPVAC